MPLVTLDFNAVVYALDTLASTEIAFTGTITEDGFTVTNPGASQASKQFATIRQGAYYDHDANDDVPLSTFANQARFLKTDGETFDLVSLQLDSKEGGGINVTITGLKADGVTTVQQVVLLDNMLSLETFVLPDTFRDLIRVDLTSPSPYQFNDVVLRDYDVLTGGADIFNVTSSADAAVRMLGGTDTLNFNGFFSNGDIADGGAGTDTFTFSGGLTATLGSGTVRNITNFEILSLLSGSYNLTMADIFVGSAETLTVTASTLTAGQTLTFNGAAEADGAFNVTGGAGADVFIGGTGNDVFAGGLGNDTYFVGAGDTVSEAVGQGTDNVAVSVNYSLNAGAEIEVLSTTNHAGTANLVLQGNAFGQTIIGNAGNNYLDGGGGGGVDNLQGLGGNDVLVVDGNDIVTEAGGGGFDTVAAKETYLLTAGAEIEVLSTTNDAGTAAIALVGNAFGQSVIGNAGNNYLDGGGGADTLYGLGGNDTFIVDGNDTVAEAIGGGSDTVAASATYVLSAGAEVETLSTTNDSGTGAIALIGNTFGQSILGNAGDNYIDGGGGADTLYGRGGNDTFIVDTNDFIVETAGGGIDTVAASGNYQLNGGAVVEVLSTTNNAGSGAINLTGNEVGQTVVGNAGVNTLNGGGGNDVLQGLGGADSFAFTTALGAWNIDSILDMVSGSDKILLDDAVFTGLTPGVLVAAQFHIGTGAADADDRIIYNPANGILFFDADGSGGGVAVQFATLGAGTPLASTDFLVI